MILKVIQFGRPMDRLIIDTNRKGDYAELYSISWLWDQGFEVYKNVGCTGSVDLVAIKDDVITLIDVKTESPDNIRGVRRNKSSRTDDQILQQVQIVSFNPDTRELRFVKHKEK